MSPPLSTHSHSKNTIVELLHISSKMNKSNPMLHLQQLNEAWLGKWKHVNRIWSNVKLRTKCKRQSGNFQKYQTNKEFSLSHGHTNYPFHLAKTPQTPFEFLSTCLFLWHLYKARLCLYGVSGNPWKALVQPALSGCEQTSPQSSAQWNIWRVSVPFLLCSHTAS